MSPLTTRSGCACVQRGTRRRLQALDAYPALRSMADGYAANNHAALAEQMQILTQMLHATVFSPIRREVRECVGRAWGSCVGIVRGDRA